MKKLLGIIVLGLLWCNVVNALTQEEAINEYLSDRELDPIEGIWISISGGVDAIKFAGEKNRIFIIYKKDNKFICKIIRSKSTTSGADFCNLTKGTEYLYYESESDINFKLYTNEIYTNKCTSEIFTPCKSYTRIWPEVPGSSSSQNQSGSKTVSSSGTAFFVNKKGNIVIEKRNPQ